VKDSKIEWCDHTFNPWIGCTKVSPGCANCYAEARDQRFADGAHWGKGAPRQRTSAANWKQPLKWEKYAKWFSHDFPGRRPRVFCASLADWLDDEVPIEWLADLLSLIRSTPNLDWLLLTKRPENWERRIAPLANFRDFGSDQFLWELKWLAQGIAPSNVWIGTTVEDQARADERIPHLLRIPAKVRFLSCEPLLGPVDLRKVNPLMRAFNSSPFGWHNWLRQRIHWIICGGESGPNARPMHPDWAHSLRDQCAEAQTAFFFKQWGEWANAGVPAFGKVKPKAITWIRHDGSRWPNAPEDENADCLTCAKVGKKAAGRELDGREHNDFPIL
jgi:protein gp37